MSQATALQMADAIYKLRSRTGRSFMECQDALEICKMDEELAKGYLMFNGLAVNVHPQEGETKQEAYRRWVMKQARELTEKLAPYTYVE